MTGYKNGIDCFKLMSAIATINFHATINKKKKLAMLSCMVRLKNGCCEKLCGRIQGVWL